MILAKARVVNKWTMVIILANLLGIVCNLQLLWPEVTDNYALVCQLGVSNLLYWFSVNGYFLHSEAYDQVPTTMIASAKLVAEGMIGILPLCIGVSVLLTVTFYSMHQYRTAPAALFTMFYLFYGDTLFDTIYAQHQVGVFLTAIFMVVWINFSIMIIAKVTLAQSEEAFVEVKFKNYFDWLTKPTRDP